MIDRKSIANDLNAIANGVTRGNDLTGVSDEIRIVLENILELHVEENHDALKESEGKTASEETENSSSPEG